ncbi:diguanylate cyclase [Halomonas piscis]|uniref:Diguanylate cyclase n=1 Tax=Halomonas piscis TaxID=3031727 RepID=A0ABY9YWK4_9GAMM|nr:diguanylate cyclase [Halomonas piscis]WNK19147.1 diguanylate cyclase [Halomonas piscis]
MSGHAISRRLMTLAFAASPVLMAIYAAWRYAMGDYVSLFTPLFMVLVLLAALLLHLYRSSSPYLPRMILLLATYLTLLAAIWHPPAISPVWLGLPLAATFLLLPLWAALAIVLLLAPAWWLTPLASASPSWVMGFLITALLLALPRWEHARRRALLRALVLGRRLAVLAIHLPQLDMAGEQFGHRARRALLDTLCREVQRQRRDDDVLGRASAATFWLVLPDTGESGALLLQERLTRELARQVLVETGQLEARVAVCRLRQGEGIAPFTARLEQRSRALAAPPERV